MKKLVNGVLADLSEAEIRQREAEETAWAAGAASRRATAVKARCSALILASLPDWKQRNLTARTLELVNLRAARALTADELAEFAANQARWDWVKAMRAASDSAEAGAIDVAAIDWPAFPR